MRHAFNIQAYRGVVLRMLNCSAPADNTIVVSIDLMTHPPKLKGNLGAVQPKRRCGSLSNMYRSSLPVTLGRLSVGGSSHTKTFHGKTWRSAKPSNTLVVFNL